MLHLFRQLITTTYTLFLEVCETNFCSILNEILQKLVIAALSSIKKQSGEIVVQIYHQMLGETHLPEMDRSVAIVILV